MIPRLWYRADGLELHPDALAALRQFACQDPTRAHMRGVFVGQGGELCATNGHACARIVSIDPGGYDPKARSGCLWSLELVDAAIAAHGRTRGRKRDACRVLLRWDQAGETNLPRGFEQVMDRAADLRGGAVRPVIAARYLALLAEAVALVCGRDFQGGPVQMNEPKADADAVLFEVPWPPQPAEDEGTWLPGSGRAGKPAPKSEEPRCSMEIAIAPCRR